MSEEQIDDTTPAEFAARLSAALEAAGYRSAYAAGKKAGMHHQTLLKYLRPSTKKGVVIDPQIPSWAVLDRLVRRLNLDIKILFPETPSPPAS